MKIQHYEIIEEIGKGNFSKVYKALNKQTKQFFALKVMNSHKNIAQKQANLLRKMSHPNIANFYQYVDDQQGFKLFLQYIPVNTLTLYEQQANGLKEDQVKCILFQIALALSYIHEKGLIHRDIKPQNILIDKSKAIIKIIDFGLAVYEQQTQTDYIATRWYRSPQNLLGTKEYTTAIDIFSLGCVIVQLYLGDPLFPGVNNLDQISRIFSTLGFPSEKNWSKGYQKLFQLGINLQQYQLEQNAINYNNKCILKEIMMDCDERLIDLIQKMLILNPKQRISAKQILKHQYFKNIKQIIPPNVYQRYQKDFVFSLKIQKSSQGYSNDQLNLSTKKIQLPNNYNCNLQMNQQKALVSEQLNKKQNKNRQQYFNKKYNEKKDLKSKKKNQLIINAKIRQINKAKQYKKNNYYLQTINPSQYQNKYNFVYKIKKQSDNSSYHLNNFNSFKNNSQENTTSSNHLTPNHKNFNSTTNNSYKGLHFYYNNQKQKQIKNRKNYIQKKPTKVHQQKLSIKDLKPPSFFRTLDSSSPPQLQSNNLSSDNLNKLATQNIQLSNKFCKLSQQIQNEEKLNVKHRFQYNNPQQKQYKNDKSFQNYQNQKLIQSVHDKQFFQYQNAYKENKDKKNSLSEREKYLFKTNNQSPYKKFNDKSPRFNYLNIQQQNYRQNKRYSKIQLSPKLIQSKQKQIRFSDWNSHLNFHQRKNKIDSNSRNSIPKYNITKNLSLTHPKIDKYIQIYKYNSPTYKNRQNFTQNFKKELKSIKSPNFKSSKKKQEKSVSSNVNFSRNNNKNDKILIVNRKYKNNSQMLKESEQFVYFKNKTKQIQEYQKINIKCYKKISTQMSGRLTSPNNQNNNNKLISYENNSNIYHNNSNFNDQSYKQSSHNRQSKNTDQKNEYLNLNSHKKNQNNHNSQSLLDSKQINQLYYQSNKNNRNQKKTYQLNQLHSVTINFNCQQHLYSHSQVFPNNLTIYNKNPHINNTNINSPKNFDSYIKFTSPIIVRQKNHYQ